MDNMNSECIAPDIPSNTIVFLDWDDTICMTSHLHKMDIKLNQINSIHDIQDLNTRNNIIALEKIVVDFIEKYKDKVKFYIVTNAGKGWVRLGLKFYPKLKEIFDEKCIMSGHDMYSALLPNQYALWKYNIYRDIVANSKANNIIGFGDNFIDREALFMLKKNNIKIKSVKFHERSFANHLVGQFELVANNFDTILNRNDDMDLELNVTVTKNKINTFSPQNNNLNTIVEPIIGLS